MKTCTRVIKRRMGSGFLAYLQAVDGVFSRTFGLHNVHLAVKEIKDKSTLVNKVNRSMIDRINRAQEGDRNGRASKPYHPSVIDFMRASTETRCEPPSAEEMGKLGVERGGPFGFIRRRGEKSPPGIRKRSARAAKTEAKVQEESQPDASSAEVPAAPPAEETSSTAAEE